MKKIIIFLISYFLLGCFSVSAYWYWNQTIWYWTSWLTSCPSDWDLTWWVWDLINNRDWAVTNSNVSLVPDPVISGAPIAKPPVAGNMYCLRWDHSNPTMWNWLWWYAPWTWTGLNVTITAGCSDTWWSWCNTASYQWRDEINSFSCNSWWWTRNTATFKTYSTTIERHICFRWKDIAWNWYVYSSVNSILVRVDKTPPTVTDNLPGGYHNVWKTDASQTINLTSNDSDSWINTTKRCAWVGCNTSIWSTLIPFTLFADYNSMIRYQTWDNVWNPSLIWTFILKLDVSPPSSVWINFWAYVPWVWVNYDVTATITCTDPYSWCDPSTYAYKEVPTATDDCTTWGWRTNTWTVTYTTTWERFLCFKASDFSNNWYTYSPVRTVRIDKLPPTATDDYPLALKWVWNNSSIETITLTWSDLHSWVSSIKWCEWSTCDLSSEAFWSAWPTITKKSIYNNIIKYRVWDIAHNFTDYSFTLKLDWPMIFDPFKDNDSDARSKIVWYLTETGSLENIFWNNAISNEYIDNNINNSDSAYAKIWDVTSWKLKISVDKNSTIRVVKFDRARYNSNKELFVLDSFQWTVAAWSWYIEKAWSILSLSWSIWASTYVFDFKTHDYAIFVKNNWTWILNYSLLWDTWLKWIYINPIDDSQAKEIRILSSYIIISNWVYVWKQSEYIKLK